MKIARVDIVQQEVPCLGGPYVMSYVTQTHLRSRLIRIVTQDGHWGVGEILRRPSIATGRAETLEDPRLAGLNGVPVAQLPQLNREWMEEGPLLRGLCFGVDTAMHDLLARATGVPLSKRIGGAIENSVIGYHSISAGALDDMARDTAAHPHHVIQIKLGVHGLAGDIARVQAVLEAAAPGQKVLADFNGALTPTEAIPALATLTDYRLIWEDPCLSYEDNCAVARALETPVLFDMCMSDQKVFDRAIADRIAGAVVIKPPFVGGLSAARKILAGCVEAGMPVRIDGPWSGQIGTAAIIHLALTAPKRLLISSADLTAIFDAPRDLLSDPAPGHFGVVAGPGVGPVAPDLFGPVAG